MISPNYSLLRINLRSYDEFNYASTVRHCTTHWTHPKLGQVTHQNLRKFVKSAGGWKMMFLRSAGSYKEIVASVWKRKKNNSKLTVNEVTWHEWLLKFLRVFVFTFPNRVLLLIKVFPEVWYRDSQGVSVRVASLEGIQVHRSKKSKTIGRGLNGWEGVGSSSLVQLSWLKINALPETLGLTLSFCNKCVLGSFTCSDGFYIHKYLRQL